MKKRKAITPLKVILFLWGIFIMFFVSLFYFSYSEEKKWEALKAERIQEGDRFKINEFYPDFEIQDKDNVAMHDAFLSLRESGNSEFNDLSGFFKLESISPISKFNKKTKLLDLSLLMRDGEERAEEESASYILEIIDRKRHLYAPYTEALKRKYSLFPFDEKEPFTTDTKHLLLFRRLADIFYLKGLCYAKLGDEQKVLESLEALERLVSREDSNFSMVHYLLDFSIKKLSFKLVNYAVSQNCVSDDFSLVFQKRNHLKNLGKSLEGKQIGMLAATI